MTKHEINKFEYEAKSFDVLVIAVSYDDYIAILKKKGQDEYFKLQDEFAGEYFDCVTSDEYDNRIKGVVEDALKYLDYEVERGYNKGQPLVEFLNSCREYGASAFCGPLENIEQHPLNLEIVKVLEAHALELK